MFRESRDAFLAVVGDQFAQGGRKGGVSEVVALDPREDGLGEGLGDIDQCRAVLLRARFVEVER